MRSLTLLLIVAGLPGLAAPVAAQQRDLAATADTIFDRWNTTHGPGCAVGVAQGGRTLLARGYGLADLETATAITPRTIFESGSVAKQFTATAVILLALDGKLSLDDPIRKYFPEMPAYDADTPITIRHLLTHTSGLREWSNLVSWAGWPRGTRAHTQTDLLDVAFRQQSLNYPVGEYYSYSNTGYAIAMSLVERVSGQTFQEFTRQRIFGPLGMTSTRWRDDFTTVVPGRAQAYGWDNAAWHLDMPFENVVGPGGLLTTVGDWLIWNDALTNRKLGAVSDSIVQRMRLKSGRVITYALGVMVLNYRGVPEISHGGSTGGYRTFLARYPDRDNLSIAVLCNAAQASAGQYARQLADRLIADFPDAAPRQAGRSDPASLARFFGMYRNDRTGAPLELNEESARRLQSLDAATFIAPNGTRWLFGAGAAAARQLRIAQADGDTVSYTFAGTRWTPTRGELLAFEGQYRNEEIGATYTVRVHGDTLVLLGRPGRRAVLSPRYRDAFARTGSSTVWFTRDRSGAVTSMHVGEARLWNLAFGRVRTGR